ncbi:MAG: hypothetical protein H6573_18345 [Lewinellaceae bacterium]|nr:hypothetical protein [Phaeodactylibacter sp.]MCB9349450.1 hypothetical protein [Lewinellaceae bacterium]
MEKSKLLALLRTFDSSELRAFKDFVGSPFFNKEETLTRLYHYLKKLAPQKFPQEKINRQEVYRELFPGEPYDERRLNHISSGLFQLAEQYIGLKEYAKQGILAETHILEAHLERRQEKAYQHRFRKAQSRLEKAPLRDAQYHLQKSHLARLSDQYFSIQKLHRPDPSLQEMADQFDVYCLSKKLSLLCEMQQRQQFLPVKYQLKLADETLSALERQEALSENPCIAVYHTLFKALSGHTGRQDFQRFRQLLTQHHSRFSEPEARKLYFSAINYCIHAIRIGKKEYTSQLMDLYIEGIKHGILLENGHISPWTYKNIVKLGLGLKRFDWVESFVREYSQYLSKEEREDAYHFNLADLFFHRQEYDKALGHLNQVEFSDIHYAVDAKATLLKIYYETRATEAYLSLHSAFKIFLKRNKNLSRNVRESYMNFIALLYQVFKQGGKRQAQLEQKIQSTNPLNGRAWLLHQLKEKQHT